MLYLDGGTQGCWHELAWSGVGFERVTSSAGMVTDLCILLEQLCQQGLLCSSLYYCCCPYGKKKKVVPLSCRSHSCYGESDVCFWWVCVATICQLLKLEVSNLVRFKPREKHGAENRNVAVEAVGLVKNCFRAPCSEHWHPYIRSSKKPLNDKQWVCCEMPWRNFEPPCSFQGCQAAGFCCICCRMLAFKAPVELGRKEDGRDIKKCLQTHCTS